MDHLKAIRVFGRVVETGSFTKAADILAIPNSTVSTLVQSLEEHLKLKLLSRTTRKVTLTADGAAYYERTANLLNELDSLESGLIQGRAAPEGQLRIAVESSIAQKIIIPALGQFKLRFPGIQLDIRVNDSNTDFVDSTADCMIRSGEPTDQLLVARKVGHLAFVTCASPAYLKSCGRPSSPKDLETSHMIGGLTGPKAGRLVPLEFEKNGEEIEITGNCFIAVNDNHAHLAVAEAGLGIVQTFEFMARELIKAGKLVPVLTDWAKSAIPVNVIYPSNRHENTKLRVFLDWLTELFTTEQEAAENFFSAGINLGQPSFRKGIFHQKSKRGAPLTSNVKFHSVKSVPSMVSQPS